MDRPGDRKHGSHNCWSCGFRGGPWELVAAVKGLSLEDAGEWIRDLEKGAPLRTDVWVPKVAVKLPRSEEPEAYRLPPGVIHPERLEDWFPPALAYLRRRAVSPWQIRKWRIGYAETGPLALRIVIPVETAGRLVSHVARAFVGGMVPYDVPRPGRRGAEPSMGLFGEPGLDPDLDVIVPCEGVFKHLRLELAGCPNPVAVLGASNVTAYKLSVMARFRRVIVAADPDAAGDALYQTIRRSLGRRCKVSRLVLEQSPDDTKVPALRAALRAAGAL